MKSQPAPRRDGLLPILLLIPAIGWASTYGGTAQQLHLPTAGFAQTSGLWAALFVGASFCLRSRRSIVATTALAVLCGAYAPLLVTLGSTTIPLARPLTAEEMRSFRQSFPVPVEFSSSSGEGDCLTLPRNQPTDAIEASLRKIGALSP